MPEETLLVDPIKVVTFSAPKVVIDAMKTQLRSSPPTVSGTSCSTGLADLEKIGIRTLCGPPSIYKPFAHEITNT